MISDPKLQACFEIFGETRPPHGTAAHAEWVADVRAFARLVTFQDLGLTWDEWRPFSNGAPSCDPGPPWWRQPSALGDWYRAPS